MGYTGSGSEHWQTWLEDLYENTDRVEQENWDVVDRDGWMSALDTKVRSTVEPTYLIGHSCGSVSIAQWAISHEVPAHVFGCLLVAPADVDAASAPPEIAAQGPMPEAFLPIPTTLVASTNDPYLHVNRAEHFATVWRTQRLLWIAKGGHLASADGFGPWQGLVRLLGESVGPLKERRRTRE